jgi:hypothetical protein
LVFFPVASTVSAQTPASFKYKIGDEYQFKIEQLTLIEDTNIDENTKKPVTNKLQSKLSVLKHWKVRDVLKDGSGVMELSISRMRLERSNGKDAPTVFDSEKPDPANPSNEAEFKKFINQTLAVVVVNPKGIVTEVKETKQTSAKGFQIDLPFKIMLPEKEMATGATWKRDFEIELPPPAGTGEKYKASQKCEYTGDANQMQKIHLSTSIADFPTGIDAIPLLKYLAEGDVYFHNQSGRYIGCRLVGRKIVENYQGEGTRYAYESSLSEDLAK